MVTPKKNTTHQRNTKNPGDGNLPIKANTAAPATNSGKKGASLASGRGSQQTKKAAPKRNTAGNAILSVLIMALGGAFTIAGFDWAVNYVAPQTSTTIRTGAKFAVGFAVGQYGRKLPIIGNYANVIQNTLFVFGFVDLVNDHVLPRLAPYLPGSLAAAPVPVSKPIAAKDPNTGELGMLQEMSDGSQLFYVDPTQGSAYQYQ